MRFLQGALPDAAALVLDHCGLPLLRNAQLARWRRRPRARLTASASRAEVRTRLGERPAEHERSGPSVLKRRLGAYAELRLAAPFGAGLRWAYGAPARGSSLASVAEGSVEEARA